MLMLGQRHFASVEARNSTVANDAVRLVAVGTGFTTSGAFLQDAGMLIAEANLSGGLNLVARADAHMRFFTGGIADANERVRITNAGNVGIGVTSPKSLLEVSNIGVNSGDINQIRIASGNDASGHVSGIGFSTMGRGADGNTGYRYTKSAIFQTQTQSGGWGTGDLVFAVDSNVDPADVAASDEKMRIKNNGNVGIGTTVPTQKLDVSGNINIPGANYLLAGSYDTRFWNPGQSVGGLTYMGQYGPAMTYLAYYNAGWKGNAGGTAAFLGVSEGQLSFATAPSSGAGAALTWTDKFVINNAGNVGIGTIGPTAKLHVYGTADTALGYIQQAKNDGGSSTVFQINDDRGYAGVNSGKSLYVTTYDTGNDTGDIFNASTYTGTYNPVLVAKINGNVGIGTTGPECLLKLAQLV